MLRQGHLPAQHNQKQPHSHGSLLINGLLFSVSPRLRGDFVFLITAITRDYGDPITSTCGATAVLGISAGQYAIISSTLLRPAFNPVTDGGPFSAIGIISFRNRSTGAFSMAR